MKCLLKQSLLATLLVSCTTTAYRRSFESARVVERIGGHSETPVWANGEVAMQSEGADIVFIHFVSMSGNSRPEACLKAAEVESRSAFLQHIKASVTTSGQLSEESAADEPSYESLTAFLSQGQILGSRTTARYWERREESAESGERVLRVRCSVKMAVKKSELERQLRLAMGRGGNKEVREELEKAQKSFIQNVGSTEQTTGAK